LLLSLSLSLAFSFCGEGCPVNIALSSATDNPGDNLQPAPVNAGHAERPLQVHQRTRLDSAEIDGRRFQARSLHNLVSHYPKPARFLSMVEWFVSHHQKELALIPILA
jgi:hypothetical protein